MLTLLLSAVVTLAAADVHTNSNLNQVILHHSDFDLTVNFSEKRILGSVLHTMSLIEGNVVDLDAKKLSIETVKVGCNKTLSDAMVVTGAKVETGRTGDAYGSKLSIPLPDLKCFGPKKNFYVWIKYSSAVGTGALSWLDGSQTESGKPFMFSQNQPIGAREWMPTQDSPAARFKYDARVKVVAAPGVAEDLGILMSAADLGGKVQRGTAKFSANRVSIPAYLLGIAVGDLEFRGIGPRTGVYAQPQVVAAAARELVPLEKALAVAERLYGKYIWGRYDSVVLPFSFPYGGMEHPNITFLNPSIIAGDRSLIHVPIHELTHSWSGNQVTNESWNDFWLNEGINTYIEHRVVHETLGHDLAQSTLSSSVREAKTQVEEVIAEAAKEKAPPMVAALKGTLKSTDDPELASSGIPYGRGAFFIHSVASRMGVAKMDAFLKSYFAEKREKTVSTEEFLKMLRVAVLSDVSLPGAEYDALVKTFVYTDAWPSVPPVESIASAEGKVVEGLVKTFESRPLNSAELKQLLGVSPVAFVDFIESIGDSEVKIPADRVAAFGSAVSMQKFRSAMIRSRWIATQFKRGIDAGSAAKQFVHEFGRTYLISPVYRAWAGVDCRAARAALTENSARYMEIARKKIGRALETAPVPCAPVGEPGSAKP